MAVLGWGGQFPMSEISLYTQILDAATTSHRCRANMAHLRQSRPESGLGFQVNVLKTFQAVPSSLGSSFPRTVAVVSGISLPPPLSLPLSLSSSLSPSLSCVYEREREGVRVCVCVCDGRGVPERRPVDDDRVSLLGESYRLRVICTLRQFLMRRSGFL